MESEIERYYRTHTLQRMDERYGILLYDREYHAMCRLIEDEKGYYADRISALRELWFIRFMNRIIPAVYDVRSKRIVTVLPEKEKQRYNIKDIYSDKEWIKLTYTKQDDVFLELQELKQYPAFCFSCWNSGRERGIFCECRK